MNTKNLVAQRAFIVKRQKSTQVKSFVVLFFPQNTEWLTVADVHSFAKNFSLKKIQ